MNIIAEKASAYRLSRHQDNGYRLLLQNTDDHSENGIVTCMHNIAEAGAQFFDFIENWLTTGWNEECVANVQAMQKARSTVLENLTEAKTLCSDSNLAAKIDVLIDDQQLVLQAIDDALHQAAQGNNIRGKCSRLADAHSDSLDRLAKVQNAVDGTGNSTDLIEAKLKICQNALWRTLEDAGVNSEMSYVICTSEKAVQDSGLLSGDAYRAEDIWERIASCEAAHPAALQYLRDCQRRLFALRCRYANDFFLQETDIWQFNQIALEAMGEATVQALPIFADYLISWNDEYICELDEHFQLVEDAEDDDLQAYCDGRYLAAWGNQEVWYEASDIGARATADQPFEKSATYRSYIEALTLIFTPRCADEAYARANTPQQRFPFLYSDEGQIECLSIIIGNIYDKGTDDYQRTMAAAETDLLAGLNAALNNA